MMSRQLYTIYQKQGLSLWPSDYNSSGFLNPVLIGPTWNIPSNTIGGIADLEIPEIDFGLFKTPAVNLGKTGATITFGGAGELGLKVAPAYTNGTLDLYYQGGVTLSYDRYPSPGNQTTVTASFTGGGGSYFKTHTPKFGLKFWSDFQVTGFANSKGYFLGDKLWDGNIFDPFSLGGAPKYIGQITDFGDTTQINQLINQLNPLPVGASIYSPDLSTESTAVWSNGSLNKSQFSRFLSIETDALAWIAMLFGDAGAIFDVLSNEVTIPGSSLVVGWDFCKAYANFDVGYLGDYTVTPQPTISLKVLNSSGQVIASGGTAVTFVMPSDRVTIVPTLSTDFKLRHHLSFGVGGALGITPIAISAKGSIGSGKHAQTYDIDFDPATVEWKGDPSGTTSLFDRTFTLPWSDADKVRTLPSIGVNAASLTDLPREVYPGTYGNLVGFIPAYTADSDKDYYTLSITPEQGRRFFAANATFTATFQKPGGTPQTLDIAFRDDSDVDIQVPKSLLAPGQYTLTLTDSTKNALGQPRSATWVIPITVFYQTPSFDGQFFKQADRDDETATNRVIDDGTDHDIYVVAHGIYKDTIVVLNGPNGNIPLATDINSDQDLTGKDYIRFTIPKRLASELAGSSQKVQIINRNLKTDASGNPLPPLTSASAALYFVANKPTVGAIKNSTYGGQIPLGDSEILMDLVGTNFTRYTKVYLRGLVTSVDDNELPVEYGSSTVLHVRFPTTIMKLVHNLQKFGPNLHADTPVANVPSVSSHEPDLVSGGVSNMLAVKFVYPTPALNRVESTALVRQSANKIRVYGDNLFRQPTKVDKQTTRFQLDGRDIDATQLIYPNGVGLIVPYVDISLLASDRAVQQSGNRWFQAYNGPVKSLQAVLTVDNGLPAFADGQTINLKVGPGRTNAATLSGGPCYPETKLYLNGSDVTNKILSLTSISMTVPANVVLPIDNKTANLVMFNPTPGGGSSSPLVVNLLERDPSTIQLTKGALTYDRASDSWAQAVTLTYKGHRNLSAAGKLLISGLPSGVTLVSPAGSDAGVPYLNVNLAEGSVKVIAKFRRTGSAAVSYTPSVKFND